MSATLRTSAVHPMPARTMLAAAGIAAGVLGVLAGGTDPAAPDLMMLLRFMAAVKAAMALAAAGLVLWRMGAPMPAGTAAAYTAATAIMAAGPGLIWTLQHVALGAAALHGGLLLLLLLAWQDRAAWGGMLGAAVARRRR